jgi:transposase
MSHKQKKLLQCHKAEIQRLYQEGTNLTQLAKLYGVSKNTMSSYLYRHGIRVYDQKYIPPSTVRRMSVRQGLAEIAAHFGVSQDIIVGIATRHKFKLKGTKKEWTQEELDYLSDNLGVIPSIKIARHLNRTLGAIRRQAYLLGETSRTQVCNYTTCAIAKIVGVCHATVLEWITSGKLPATKVQFVKGFRYYVKRYDIIKFLRERGKLTEQMEAEFL